MATEKRLIDQEKVYQCACTGCTKHGNELGECYHDEPCERLIFAFTTAEPEDAVEVVHGRWIAVPSSDMMTGKAYKCSECGKMRYGSYQPNYCQHCGAKMDGGNEDG